MNTAKEIREHVMELAKDFSVDKDGEIDSPGKFEGEPMEALYWYERLNEGDGELQDDGSWMLEVSPEEAEAFHIASGSKDTAVYCSETDNGFFTIQYR